MLRHLVQRNREQNFARRIGDFQVPSTPVDLVGLALLAQFLDGLDGLIMGGFQIRDFNPCLIKDPFMPVHEVKETMHAKAALKNASTAGFQPFRSLPLNEQFPCNDAR
jgi:hypothetical protein